jgi:anti-anti-sigma regulatory factor
MPRLTVPTGINRVLSLCELGMDRGDGKVAARWSELVKYETNITIELGGVETLDQDLLTLLFRFRTFVRAHGGEVSLCALNARVRLQAQTMQLHRFFEIYNTAQEATRSSQE